MKVISERTLIDSVVERWRHQYRGHHNDRYSATGDQLALLKPTTAAEVSKIIGNDSWTRVPDCSECGAITPAVVELGPEYEPVVLCAHCLRVALAFIGATESQASRDSTNELDSRAEKGKTE